MATGTHIAEAYDALIQRLEALKADFPGLLVRGLTGGDFDAETALLTVKPPAVLVMFVGEDLERRRDHTALTYQSGQRFQVICGARSLRSTQEERIGALELLSAVADALAGLRPQLPSSAQKGQVVLGRVALAQFDADGTWYTLEAMVDSVAQFSANAA